MKRSIGIQLVMRNGIIGWIDKMMTKRYRESYKRIMRVSEQILFMTPIEYSMEIRSGEGYGVYTERWDVV